jgi:tetratricopeptide (TPR) repeat protein
MEILNDSLVREQSVTLPSQSVLVLEAPAGAQRTEWIEERLKQHARTGARIFRLSCDFERGGPWAGVTQLFAGLFDEIRKDHSALAERHGYEIVHVLPLLRRSLQIRNPNLTDMASDAERTRNYPADRAVRNVHGLIDLLDEWKSVACPSVPWVLACDSLDESGTMGLLFFRELMRRRSILLNISLIAGVAPGNGHSVRATFDPRLRTELVTKHFDVPATVPADRLEAATAAVEVENRIGEDELDTQANLPRLIYLWKTAEHPRKSLHYGVLALETYVTQGLYDDALRYGDGLFDLALRAEPVDEDLRWHILSKILNAHMCLGHVDACLKLADEVGVPLAEGDADRKYQLFYLMAIFHGRLKKPRDFQKGEEYLELGLSAIAECEVPEDERHFRYVFNRNGLAMIRNFQRRPQEAIELCRSGFAYLNQHLDANEHRLHRSILLYNIAQVYAAIGLHTEALEYFGATIKQDPNYSEYYNDRASVLLQIGRLEEAEADYLRAMELSPPYFEVFTNLGQCYRRMGAFEDAIKQYSRALDLKPSHLLGRLGRAKAYEEAGYRDAAIEDYSAVLAMDASLWEALGNRGALLYEAGRLQDSLADLDAAIRLKPEVVELHENRAIIFSEIKNSNAVWQKAS